MVSILWSALWFRIRGGLIPLGSSTAARLVFALAMTYPVIYDWRLAALAPAWYLGSVLAWYKSIDMGRIEGTWLWDASKISLRGITWTILPVGVFYFFGYEAWSLVLAGFLCPLAYELGWRIPSKIKGLRQGPELSEVIFGSFLGLGMWLTTWNLSN